MTVEDLHPHYVYSLAISAVTIGPGPYSQLHTVQMPEDGKITNWLMHNQILLYASLFPHLEAIWMLKNKATHEKLVNHSSLG